MIFHLINSCNTKNTNFSFEVSVYFFIQCAHLRPH